MACSMNSGLSAHAARITDAAAKAATTNLASMALFLSFQKAKLLDIRSALGMKAQKTHVRKHFYRSSSPSRYTSKEFSPSNISDGFGRYRRVREISSVASLSSRWK